jgi:hypothetical protein
MALHVGHLLWDRKDSLSNFSLFICGRLSAFAVTSQEFIILHMSSTYGGGLLEVKIIKALKQARLLPVDVVRTVEHIHSFHGDLANIIEEHSPAAKNIKYWIPRMFAHISVYEIHVERNIDFLAMIIFSTDLAVQTHTAVLLGVRGSGGRRCRAPELICSTGDGVKLHTLCKSPGIPVSHSKTSSGVNIVLVHHERYQECSSRTNNELHLS